MGGSCVEAFGEVVESAIARAFYWVGLKVGRYPRWTMGLCILLTVIVGSGFAMWETENRPEELWVPQNTIAEDETASYQTYFASNSRFNQIIVSARGGGNVLTKEALMDAMELHTQIATEEVKVEGETETLETVCTKAGGSCLSRFDGVCSCLLSSILKQWNYDAAALEADDDYMSTLNRFGTKDDLMTVLGNPEFNNNGTLVSAQAFTLSYFLDDRAEVVAGTEVDKVGEAWEKDVFLKAAESVPKKYPAISVDYLAARSFGDEFGGAM